MSSNFNLKKILDYIKVKTSPGNSFEKRLIQYAEKKTNHHVENYNANVARGFYPAAEITTEEYEKVRDKINLYLGLSHNYQITFLPYGLDFYEKQFREKYPNFIFLNLKEKALNPVAAKNLIKSKNPEFIKISPPEILCSGALEIICIKNKIFDQIEPVVVGGGMIESVTEKKTTFKKNVKKFEAGTPAIIQIIRIGHTIDFLQNESKNKENNK